MKAQMTNGVSRRRFLSAALFAARRAMAQERPDTPKQVLIVRHAEKSGLKTDIHLNARGFERAAALPRLFPAKFDTPEALFATHRTAHSNRPLETVMALAKALRLNVDDHFGENDYTALAKTILVSGRYRAKTVLVCWHHGRIPALAAALGAANAPAHWPDQQFDRVWRIQYLNGQAAFENLPQHLLEGDS